MSYINRYVDFVDGTIHYVGKLGSCSTLDFKYIPSPVPTATQMSEMVFLPDVQLYESPKPPKDKDKWSQIKKSGAIKFTPYQRSKSRTTSYVFQSQRYVWSLGQPSCPDGPVHGPEIRAVSTWGINYTPSDIPMLRDLTVRDMSVVPDIEAERNSLRSQVVSSNLMTFDLGTELAEAHSTAKTILGLIQAVRSPIQSFLAFRRTLLKRGDLSPSQIKKALEQKWMEYRYAIMPLMYSVQDVMKLVKEKDNIYKTDRKSKEFSYTVGSKPTSAEGLYLWTQEEVFIRISAVGRASYDPAELNLRLFDQIGINPFVTAWELLPWSFVVDWFANVGDWVLARTANFGPGAQQRLFCQSIKEKRVISTYMVDKTRWYAGRSYNDGRLIEVGPFYSDKEGLLVQVEKESYSRSLFTTDDVHLQMDVFLNWKRMIDAWCLSQRPLITALRKLR